MKQFLYTQHNKFNTTIDKSRCRISVFDRYHAHQCSFKAKHFKEDIGLCTKHAKEEGYLDKDNLVSKWVGRVDKYGKIKIGKIELFESKAIYSFRKGDQSLVDYSSKLKKEEWDRYLHNSEEEATAAISEQLYNRVGTAKRKLQEAKEQYANWTNN